MSRISYQAFALFSPLLLIFLVVVGCSNNTQTAQQTQATSSAIDYDSTISDLAQSIFDTNQLYVDNLVAAKSSLTTESIDSIKGLIEISTKKAQEKYNQLSQYKGNKKDQVDVLKKGLDKLLSMRSDLNRYTDSIENKKKIGSNWQIVVNYWKTYSEMTKK